MKKIPFANHNIPHTEEEKQQIVQNAAKAYESFLDALQFDWRSDPNSSNTPMRVAKAMVYDLISGCYADIPKITSFPARGYTGVIFEGNIPVTSLCSHHHAPFIGKAHIAYIPNKHVLGLSKLNRIVDFYSRRPQIQEDLTNQISEAVDGMIPGNKGVAVMVSATHFCVCNRGVRHGGCEMKTSKLTKDFMKDPATRAEFYTFINNLGKN